MRFDTTTFKFADPVQILLIDEYYDGDNPRR